MLRIPDWQEYFMRHAYLAASKSKDKSTQIGAVIIYDGAVIGEGYNGLPRGCCDTVEERLERPEKYFWFEHAERNAIYNCAARGIKTRGAIMYTQGVPCVDCGRGLAQSGIIGVCVHKQWEEAGAEDVKRKKWGESQTRTSQIFEEVGVDCVVFDRKLGVKILKSGKIIEV